MSRVRVSHCYCYWQLCSLPWKRLQFWLCFHPHSGEKHDIKTQYKTRLSIFNVSDSGWRHCNLSDCPYVHTSRRSSVTSCSSGALTETSLTTAGRASRSSRSPWRTGWVNHILCNMFTFFQKLTDLQAHGYELVGLRVFTQCNQI